MAALSMLLHPHVAESPSQSRSVGGHLDSLEGLIVMAAVLLGIAAFLGAIVLFDWLIRRAG